MNQKWKRLVDALRKQCAYEGDGSLADVQKFVKEADLTEQVSLALGEGETLESIHAKSAKKPILVIEDDEQDAGDEDDQTKVKTPRGPAKKQHRIAADTDTPSGSTPKSRRLAAACKAYDRKAARGEANFGSAEDAMTFGAWAKTVCFPKLCTQDDFDIVEKANVGTTYTSGGALIPDDFAADIINLKEKYGVVRGLVPFRPMKGDLLKVGRRTGGLTVYAPGEATAITESNPAVDNIELKATKLATITTESHELESDAIVSFGDLIAQEIAQAFALDEDTKYFNSDGTSTYHHFTGLGARFTATVVGAGGTFTTDAHKIYNPNITVATSKTWASIVLNDFFYTASTLMDIVTDPVWVMHKTFFWSVAARVMGAAGGVTWGELANGQRVPMLLGIPVVFSQVLPYIGGTGSQFLAYVGDFKMGSKCGEVSGGMAIASSEDRYFELDAVAIRGVQRIAMTVHDVGTANSSAASRVQGPIAALVSPN